MPLRTGGVGQALGANKGQKGIKRGVPIASFRSGGGGPRLAVQPRRGLPDAVACDDVRPDALQPPDRVRPRLPPGGRPRAGGHRRPVPFRPQSRFETRYQFKISYM
jgi:hypothetical protein